MLSDTNVKYVNNPSSTEPIYVLHFVKIPQVMVFFCTGSVRYHLHLPVCGCVYVSGVCMHVYLCTMLQWVSLPLPLVMYQRLARGHRRVAVVVLVGPDRLPPMVSGPAVFSMPHSVQRVEPMLVWLIWLGGKWKSLTSLRRLLVQGTGEVIWIAMVCSWTNSLPGCFVYMLISEWVVLFSFVS